MGLDNFFSTSRQQVEAAWPAGTQLIAGDIANPDDVGKAFDAIGHNDTVVYHLAAQPSAAIAASAPQITEHSNLVGARVVLEAALERQARVVFGGSFRVYGDDLIGRSIDEQTPYGRVGDLSHLSKIYVEQLARMIGVPFVSVRLGVAYGVSPIMKTTAAFMTVPNLFCQRASRGDGLQILEDRPMAFIHVRDAADALIASARRQARTGDVWDVVNAAPEVVTIGQVARIVQHAAHARGIAARMHGQSVSEATFDVLSRLDGFTPSRSMAEGLGEVMDYFLDKR